MYVATLVSNTLIPNVKSSLPYMPQIYTIGNNPLLHFSSQKKILSNILFLFKLKFFC